MTYTPEILVRRILRNPVRVHVLEQVVPTEWFQERADSRTVVCRNNCTICQTIGGVRRRHWVVLAAQIAVLSVRTIAIMGCQSFDCSRRCLHFTLTRNQAINHGWSSLSPAIIDLQTHNQCRHPRIVSTEAVHRRSRRSMNPR